MTVYIKSYVGL